MIDLPSKTSDLVEFLDQLRDSAILSSRPRKVQWLVNHYWLQGCRNLGIDLRDAAVTATFYNPVGLVDETLRVKVEDLVVRFQAEMGRLMRMDIRPAVERRGFGLNSLRHESAARVIFDFLMAPVDDYVLKTQIIYKVMAFGMCGVAMWARANRSGLEMMAPDSPEAGRVDRSSVESRLVMETIPPWQLYPVPHQVYTTGEVEGILRRRWVPVEWLKRHMGPRVPSDPKKLRTRTVPYGVNPDVVEILTGDPAVDTASTHLASGKADKGTVEYALLEEWFWLQDERDRLGGWTVKVGDWIPNDLNRRYETRSVYCPIGICRYHPVSGFYGRSWVEILQPLASEQEEMLGTLFDNVKKLDIYGTLLFPVWWGISKDELLDRKRRDRVLFYEPDPMSPDNKQQVVTPVNLNDFPGKVAGLAGQMMDKMTQQSDLMRGDAPGRVDSLPGLSFLNEQAAIPLSVPANAIADGLTQCYKEVLAAAPELIGDRDSLPLLGLDDNILGLRVDASTGAIYLNAKNFPTPFDVKVSIRDRLPTPPAIREQKLLAMLEREIITPVMFRFHVWKENLDLPVGNWAEQENFRKAILQCLTSFGDGETPGNQVFLSQEADNPEIFLMVIEMFMAKPEFQFAGIQVRKRFEEMKGIYRSFLGRGYPQGLPRPEDAALIEQQIRQAQEAQARQMQKQGAMRTGTREQMGAVRAGAPVGSAPA